jgi:hypothetical protein
MPNRSAGKQISELLDRSNRPGSGAAHGIIDSTFFTESRPLSRWALFGFAAEAFFFRQTAGRLFLPAFFCEA